MFYFDVHPPLAKMLIALGAWLAKADINFEFPSGKEYPAGLNYIMIRMFVAAFGTLVVPLTFMTAIQMKLSRMTATLCALMSLFDNGFIGIMLNA